MGARKTFLYYLFSKNKRALYKEGNQVLESDTSLLKPNGQPAHLENDPGGWRNTLVKYARNLKYWGLFRDMTVPMKFILDGAFILQMQRAIEGYETEAYMGIGKLDRIQLGYTYKPWYVSELNFTKYKEDEDGVQIEALEGGVSKYLKAFENTRYSIDIDQDPEHISSILDGMEIDNSATFVVTNGFSIDPNFDIGNHLLEAAVVQKEIEDIGGVGDVLRTKITNDNTALRASKKWIFKATAAGTVKAEWGGLSVTIAYTPPPAVNPAAFLKIVIRRIDTTNFSNFQTEILSINAGHPFNGTYNLTGTDDIPVSPGDELYLYGFVSVEGASGDAQTKFTYGGTEPFLKLTYTFRQEESIVRGHSPLHLGEKIVEKMTEGKYKLKSNFLSSLDGQIMVTSSDAIRGIRGAVIKTSFADYFKSFNRWCIGCGIEGEYLVIERRADFHKSSILIDLGQVTGASLDVAEDLLFNTLNVGYGKYDYKEINGRLEFNQGQSWSAPSTKIQNELDITSVYRADPFGIEILRINFEGKTTTDTDSDGDNFLINIKPQFSSFRSDIDVEFGFFNYILIKNNIAQLPNFKKGVRFRVTGTQFNDKVYTVFDTLAINATDFIIGLDGVANQQELNVIGATIDILSYILNRPAYSSVLGLLHPASTFNIELSPKRSLIEWGAYIHSIFDLLDTRVIKQTSAIKNVELVTTLNGLTISEKEDISIVNLPSKIFLPYYFEFKTEVPVNLIELMASNPYGKVKFYWNERYWYGWLFDGGLRPADNEAQTWKLLASPENDLTKFNRYA